MDKPVSFFYRFIATKNCKRIYLKHGKVFSFEVKRITAPKFFAGDA